jgi:hypothetical protein
MRIAMFQRLIVPAMCLGAALWAAPTLAASESFQTQLSGSQQVPAVDTQGTGTADFRYNPTTRRLSWTITYSGLSSPVTMAHLHAGASGSNGKPVVWLTMKGSKDNPSPIKGHATLTEDQAKMLMDGGLYINIHTADHPSGEVRGQVMPPSS